MLYRQGETLRGEVTYTPRLVLFDLSGSLGGTSGQGSLYQDATPAVVSTWHGQHEVHRSTPVAKSSFVQQVEEEAEGEEEQEGQQAAASLQQRQAAREQLGQNGTPDALAAAARQLDGAGGVRYFTDYLKAHLHPRSIYQLQGLWQGVVPFDGWGDGAAYALSSEHREEMIERVRWVAAGSTAGWPGHHLHACAGSIGQKRNKIRTAMEAAAVLVPGECGEHQAVPHRPRSHPPAPNGAVLL